MVALLASDQEDADSVEAVEIREEGDRRVSEGGRSRWEDAADTRDEGREHESRRERDREAAAAPDRQMVRAASWSEGRVFRARVPAAAAVVKESASPFPGEQEAQRDAGREVSPNQRDDLTRQMVSERVCASEQASVCVCFVCLRYANTAPHAGRRRQQQRQRRRQRRRRRHSVRH